MVCVYSYSSVRNFVIVGTDENWYMMNNNQFTVYILILQIEILFPDDPFLGLRTLYFH